MVQELPSLDLAENRDMYGFYVGCLRCPYYLTDSERTTLLDRCLVDVTPIRRAVAPRRFQNLRNGF